MDRDIAGLILALKGALATDDEAVGIAAALTLVGVALDALGRIADAAELIAHSLPDRP